MQRTASNILASLYKRCLFSSSGLSAKELAIETGLSHSTISSVCSRLETLDILTKSRIDNQQRKGRKSAIYTLTVGIDEFLRRGLKKNLSQVEKVSRAIDQLLVNISSGDGNSIALIAKTANEINLFLSEPYVE